MTSRKDDRAGGDTIPPLPKVNSLQALMRLRPKRGCEWCTFAFVLNRDMIRSDGSLDDLHAMVFPLGAFDSEERAEEHAKNIISITGHPAVVAAKYGAPVPLTLKFDTKVITEVPVDLKGRIIELESDQYKREREEYERRVQREREIMKEQEDEIDPDNIEHFKRQAYLAIKNRANYQHHSRETDSAWDMYKKREAAVRDHYVRHPEHERDWLPYLKEKLTERGEMSLYFSMEAAYKEIRDELLGLIPEDNVISEPEVIIPDSKPENSISEIKLEEPINNCPGGVCLPPNTAICDWGTDDCDGGICLAVTSTKETCIENVNEKTPNSDDEIMTVEELAKITTNTDPVPSSNIQFVDEDSSSDDKPYIGPEISMKHIPVVEEIKDTQPVLLPVTISPVISQLIMPPPTVHQTMTVKLPSTTPPILPITLQPNVQNEMK